MLKDRMLIRAERPGDAVVIAALTTAAFADAQHSSGTEAAIVDGLRAAGVLSLSLVAEDEAGNIIGHIAFSPVEITSEGEAIAPNWYGLGPVSVAPERQGQGIGGALIHEGLMQLEKMGAAGCVLLGDPGYYSRFGFIANAGPIYPGPPPEYFQALALGDNVMVQGIVRYHIAFNA